MSLIPILSLICAKLPDHTSNILALSWLHMKNHMIPPVIHHLSHWQMHGANLVLEKWGQGRFLRSTVKLNRNTLLCLFVKRHNDLADFPSFTNQRAQGAKGGRRRRTLSSKVGSAKIRGGDVKARLQRPQRLQARFLDFTPWEEFWASSKVAF